MSPWYTATDQFVMLPALLLTMFGVALLVFQFLARESRAWMAAITVIGLVAPGIAMWRQQGALSEQTVWQGFGGALVLDETALFFNWLTLLAAAMVLIASIQVVGNAAERRFRGDFNGIVLLAAAAMVFTAGASDLIVMFLGLETMSICFYLLVAFERERVASTEAALKYLILGAFSSALLAYGFSLLYGLAGSTRLTAIREVLESQTVASPWLVLGLATMLAGLLFKMGAAPFHVWAPDAYQGAPTAITAYLSTASRAAAFVVLLRLGDLMVGSGHDLWTTLLAAAAVLSLWIGNFAALTQQNVKRLLAYGSISHTGYLMLGLVARSAMGLQGFLLYLAVYVVMTLAAFLVLASLRSKGEPSETLDQLTGLSQRAPAHAWLLALALVSLVGLPPTAGFIGKYFIFRALLEQQRYGLAVMAALYLAVSVIYYFRVVRVMFFRPTQEESAVAASTWVMRAAALASVIAVVAAGVYPEPLIEWTARVVSR